MNQIMREYWTKRLATANGQDAKLITDFLKTLGD